MQKVAKFVFIFVCLFFVCLYPDFFFDFHFFYILYTLLTHFDCLVTNELHWAEWLISNVDVDHKTLLKHDLIYPHFFKKRTSHTQAHLFPCRSFSFLKAGLHIQQCCWQYCPRLFSLFSTKTFFNFLNALVLSNIASFIARLKAWANRALFSINSVSFTLNFTGCQLGKYGCKCVCIYMLATVLVLLALNLGIFLIV
jgi:hypothetical protein